MKKLIGSCLLSLVLLAPLGASATTTPTQADINLQLQSLINSLMTQVQELMKQLIAMQAKQVEQGQTLSTIQTQTAPTPVQVLGSVAPAGPSISLGKEYCRETTVNYPVNIEGGNWNYGEARVVRPTDKPYAGNPDGGYGIGFERGTTNKVLGVENNQGSVQIKVLLSNSPITPFNMVNITPSYDQTIIVGNVCQ